MSDIMLDKEFSPNNSRRQKYFQIGLLSSAHFLIDFYCNFLPVLLPVLIAKLGLSLTLSGVLVMIMSFSANVLQPVFGYFMDKYNFNQIIPFILPFGAVFICTVSLTDNFFTLLLLVALSGLAVSALHPMGAGLVSRAAPQDRISTSMSFFVSGGNLGFALAPILLVMFINAYDLAYLPLLIIPALILGALIYFSGLGKMRFVDEEAAKDIHFNFMEIVKNKPLMFLNLSMGIRAWVFTAIVTFLPLRAMQLGEDSTTGGWLLTLFLCGSTAGSLIAGFLNEKFGYKKIILISLILGVFPCVYFLTVQEINFGVCAALFMAGAMTMAPNPGAVVWGQKFLPDNPAMASGMMLGLSFGLGGVGTMLTGAAAESAGLGASLTATAALLVVGAVFAYLTPETLPEK